MTAQPDGDGLYQVQVRCLNRLVGALYCWCDMSDGNERLATCEYDGMSRRIGKIVANQGRAWNGSDAYGYDGIRLGTGMSIITYSEWRLVEMRTILVTRWVSSSTERSTLMSDPLRPHTDLGGESDTAAGRRVESVPLSPGCELARGQLTAEDGKCERTLPATAPTASQPFYSVIQLDGWNGNSRRGAGEQRREPFSTWPPPRPRDACLSEPVQAVPCREWTLRAT